MTPPPVGHERRKRRRLGITARLLVLTFAIIMGGFVLETGLHLHDDYNYRKDVLQTRATLLADLHAAALAGPLWDFERDIIDKTLARLTHVDDVLGAKVTYPSGELVASIGDYPNTKDGIISVRREIVWQNNGDQRQIGFFEIALSTDSIKASLLRNVSTSAAIIAILILVVFGALFLVVRHITGPLEVLNGAIRRLAEGGRGDVIPYLDRNDEIGRIAAAVKMFSDNADELDALRHNLEAHVREQTHDLRRAMEEAEIANVAKSEFLSSMSHELRTPLNAIMGFAQLLELDAPKYKNDPRYGEAVTQIMSSSNQLLELIEQVLDLSRIESDSMDITMDTTPIDPIVRSAISSQKALAEKYKITVAMTNQTCWHSKVQTDAGLLRQVLQHFVSNAIKYNRPGGRAEVSCTQIDDKHIRIAVTDTGRGIAPEKQHELFQPFHRLGAESSVIEGTGIGLAIAKKLTDAMGAKLGFDSALGTGSTFWVDVPIAIDAPSDSINDAPAPLTEKVDAQPLNKLVLYVEDSPANVALLEEYFAVMGDAPELIIAETGEAGVEMALAHNPGVILMDINLPGISGTEAMVQLRQTQACKNTFIAAVSADATQEEIEKGLAAGFDDYLTKPIKLSLLKDVIHRQLAN